MGCSDKVDESPFYISSNKEGLNVMEKGLTMIQRVAICFAAGIMGGLAVVLFGRVMFALGLSATFGVKAPISLNPPYIYTGRSSGAGCGVSRSGFL